MYFKAAFRVFPFSALMPVSNQVLEYSIGTGRHPSWKIRSTNPKVHFRETRLNDRTPV